MTDLQILIELVFLPTYLTIVLVVLGVSFMLRFRPKPGL